MNIIGFDLFAKICHGIHAVMSEITGDVSSNQGWSTPKRDVIWLLIRCCGPFRQGLHGFSSV